MNALPRVLILMPYDSDLYVAMLTGLKKAFERVGWIADLIPSRWRDIDLKQMAEGLQPDVIFAVNRPRSTVQWVPNDAIYISWIQDHFFLSDQLIKSDSQDADITYFITRRMFDDFPVSEINNAKVLLCGVDTDVFKADLTLGDVCDATFVGFIGHYNDTQRHISVGGKQVELRKYFEQYQNWVLKSQVSAQNFSALLNLRDQFLAEHGAEHGALAKDIRHIVDEIIPRSADRAIIIHQLLDATTDTQIFGPDHWKSWPAFAPYYHGVASAPSDVARIYAMGRVSVHNGGYLAHPRVMEAMGAGAVMLANADAYADTLDAPGANFIPGENVLLYPPGGLKAVAQAALADHDLRRRIRANAAALIRARHTWDHRVAQILADLHALGRDFHSRSTSRDDASLHSGHIHP